MEALVSGAQQYNNIQPVIRMTFKCLVETVRHQNELQQCLLKRVEDNEIHCRNASVSMRTIRTLLDGHVEVLRAEFSPKLRSFETRLNEVTNRLHEMERQKEHADPRSNSSNCGRCCSSSSNEALLTLTRRTELLQSDLLRLVRMVDNKADGAEVEGALRQRVSKASLPKRIQDLLLPTRREQELLLGKLKARLESTEAKYLQQEEVMRRVVKEVEAVRSHLLGSQEGSARGEGSITGIIKHLRQLLDQQAKRVGRMDKEVHALDDKVIKELAMLEGRVEERFSLRNQDQNNNNNAPPISVASLKSLQEEIFKVCM